LSAGEAVVWALLAVGVVAQLLAVLGLLVAAGVYDRLHYIGPGSIIGPVALAFAIILDEGPFSQAGLKSALVAILLLALSPVLVHATARAAYVREHGSLAPLADSAEDARQ
jgi:monovalent cation/proton antiporter MnhG/PhaG subunit